MPTVIAGMSFSPRTVPANVSLTGMAKVFEVGLARRVGAQVPLTHDDQPANESASSKPASSSAYRCSTAARVSGWVKT